MAGRKQTDKRISVRWALAAAMSIAIVGWFAPGGLYLLGFLGVVILSHEAGHLFVARRSGMRPTEYYWGFGPEIVGFDHRGCRYGVKALFLGGYVKIEGMSPSAVLPEGFDEAGTYRAASHRGRLATILAGPLINLAMGALAFGVAAALDGAGLGEAAASGVGDVWFVITGTGEALWSWVSNLGAYIASVFDFSGATQAPVRFMSPVSQAEVSRWAVGDGLTTALRWFAILSCAVGMVNLLPLPPLDGSHAVIAAVEGVAGRIRPSAALRFDVARLLPLAYLTLTVLVLLSVSALVLDIRDLT